jgi:hypothetical protein
MNAYKGGFITMKYHVRNSESKIEKNRGQLL